LTDCACPVREKNSDPNRMRALQEMLISTTKMK
jgi:hypothetical protein